jgi:hypothetical protein
MDELHRYNRLKWRMIAVRFGGLDEGLVTRDRSDPEKDRDGIQDPKVVSGSHEAKYLSQHLTLAARRKRGAFTG